MTDTAPQALAEIAGKLSPAQRRIIIAARATLFETDWVIPLRNRWTTKVVMNLRAKGLSEEDMINRDRLTASGKALRSYLMSNSEGEE